MLGVLSRAWAVSSCGVLLTKPMRVSVANCLRLFGQQGLMSTSYPANRGATPILRIVLQG